MNYPIKIYVDSAGQTYGAAQTDQARTKDEARTVNGRPVVYAGTWYGSQMSYRPFKAAVAEAAQEAAQEARGSRAE